jgi:hypothetical protein
VPWTYGGVRRKERETKPEYKHPWYPQHIGTIVVLAVWIVLCAGFSMWCWDLVVDGTGTLVALGVLYLVPAGFGVETIRETIRNRSLENL